MTAFLFIPATVDANGARRVDFANIASLFAESEEPARRSATAGNLLRVAAAALLLLLVIGDALLVARPSAGTGLPVPPNVAARTML